MKIELDVPDRILAEVLKLSAAQRIKEAETRSDVLQQERNELLDAVGRATRLCDTLQQKLSEAQDSINAAERMIGERADQHLALLRRLDSVEHEMALAQRIITEKDEVIQGLQADAKRPRGLQHVRLGSEPGTLIDAVLFATMDIKQGMPLGVVPLSAETRRPINVDEVQRLRKELAQQKDVTAHWKAMADAARASVVFERQRRTEMEARIAEMEDRLHAPMHAPDAGLVEQDLRNELKKVGRWLAALLMGDADEVERARNGAAAYLTRRGWPTIVPATNEAEETVSRAMLRGHIRALQNQVAELEAEVRTLRANDQQHEQTTAAREKKAFDLAQMIMARDNELEGLGQMFRITRDERDKAQALIAELEKQIAALKKLHGQALDERNIAQAAYTVAQKRGDIYWNALMAAGKHLIDLKKEQTNLNAVAPNPGR